MRLERPRRWPFTLALLGVVFALLLGAVNVEMAGGLEPGRSRERHRLRRVRSGSQSRQTPNNRLHAKTLSQRACGAGEAERRSSPRPIVQCKGTLARRQRPRLSRRQSADLSRRYGLRELACRVEARLLIGGERYSQGAEAGPHRHEPQTDAIVRGQRLSAGRQAAPVSCARPCRARSAPGSPRPPAASIGV
jgi:hypothetical protein